MTDVEQRVPVPLRTLHGIELAAVGTWKASTGETTFTNEDFANAVAALDCPGVRNPVIKLGHAEEDSTSGVRWDGEPAVGWIGNMRFDGAKIYGDLTGLPAWMADAQEGGLSVLAAAYPDRSIEIYRPFVCQIGHEHPSVITALSLLGVYAPGVGVLKSMQDVYAAFTMAPDEYPAQPGEYVVKATDLPSAKAMLTRLNTSVRMAAAAERRDLSDIEKRSGVDLDALNEQWTEAVDALMDAWPDISEAQRDELAAQIADAVDSDPATLADITADAAATESALLPTLAVVAALAAAGMVAEAASQGVSIALPDITDELVSETARSVAAAMASSTASTAGRTAAQLLGSGTGADVAALTRTHLAELSDAFPRAQFGGAISAAQAAGRLAVVESFDGPATYYASEALDTNTCTACREIDLTKFDDLDAARAAYGSGKYVACLGRERCRGHLITIFGSDATTASAPIAANVRITLGGAMPSNGVVKASVSVEDISRKYYEAAGYSMWITAMHVNPLELIASDDASGKFYRIPVELNGEEFAFGEPQEVAMVFENVAAAAAALPVRFDDRKAAFAAAGKTEDGKDLVAKDVSPAGQAIRKAVHKATTPVLETEVVSPEPVVEPDKTPDADPATGPTITPKEASVDAAKMREALGLGPDATEDEVRQAFAAQLSTTPATPETDPLAVLTAKLPAGERPILVDPENYKSLLSMAVKGEKAFAEVTKARGREVLEKAAAEGRFPVARLSVYQEMWDKNPEETEAYINLMPKNTVPTLASGVLGQEISQNESDTVYTAMYGTEAK